METPPPSSAAPLAGTSWKKVVLIALGALLLGAGLSAAAAAWWVKTHFYAGRIQPVQLNEAEKKAFDAKLQALEQPAPSTRESPIGKPTESDRTLLITSREINAYLAEQQLGESMKVELGEDQLIATWIIPVPRDSGVPLLAGKTLRLRVALEAALDAAKKWTIKIHEVRLGGVPLPNAWLGDIKGLNLAEQNLESDPVLQRFLAGIKTLKIQSDGLKIVLNE